MTGATATRSVAKHVVRSYTYDAATRRTTVQRFDRATVSVTTQDRPGATYPTLYRERTDAGTWAPVPYVWSTTAKALVYDHYLHLLLTRTSTRRAAVPYVTRDLDEHLLRRATGGPTPASLAELRTLGRDAWLDRQLDPAAIDDTTCDSLLTAFPHQREPIWQLNERWQNGELDQWRHLQGIAGAQLARQCFSRRQLLEVMVEFWSQHFNVTLSKDGVGPSRAHYANTLRANAFGRFSDLLWKVTTHPSMLVYLDNAESSDEHPNENLGRELLELHSVGIGAGYGEAGVLDSARILTGLTVSSDSGEFLYAPWRHWVGPVRVLGFTDPNPDQPGGLAVARRYVGYLAKHPSTARRIANRLALQFVSDAPPAALVDRLAAVYLRNDTRIAPVLRALFTAPEFDAAVGAKLRRPHEHVVAMVRRLGFRPASRTATRDAMAALGWLLDSAGMPPLARETPDGYPLRSSSWLSTTAVLGRWNAAMELTNGWANGHAWNRPDLRTFLFGTGARPDTFGALVDAAALRLFGVTLLAADRQALLAVMGVSASTRTADHGWLAGDGIGWWVAAMLQTPYHLTA